MARTDSGEGVIRCLSDPRTADARETRAAWQRLCEAQWAKYEEASPPPYLLAHSYYSFSANVGSAISLPRGRAPG